MAFPSTDLPRLGRLLVLLSTLGSLLVLAPCSGQVFGVPEILYLKFNEGSGTFTSDDAFPGVGSVPTINSTAGWNASPHLGAACLSGLSPLPVATGCSFVTTNHPFTVTGSWTIETWVRPDAAPASAYRPICGTVIGAPYTTTPQTFFAIGQWPFSSNILLSGTGIAPVWLPGALTTGVWSHVAWVYDAAAAMITSYLNGIAQVTVAQPNPITINTGPEGLYVGYDPTVMNFALHGSLDEFRFWGHARTAAEIQSDMNWEVFDNVVRSIRLRWPHPSITFNPATAAFSLAGTIETVSRQNGSSIADPGLDPIVGATLSMSGFYSGTDLVGLTDIILTSIVGHIVVVPGVDELTFYSQFSTAAGAGDYIHFTGPLTSEPATFRALGPVGVTPAARIGSGSHLLDGVAAAFSNGGGPSLVFALMGGGPLLSSVEIDFVLPAPVTERVFATDGAGRADIGIVGVPPSAPVYNIFAINPSTPVGSGPLFGLEFGPFQFAQIVLPFPTPPFQAVSSPAGTYYFSAPTGTVPTGLVVDVLTAAFDPATGVGGVVGSITRMQF